MIFQCLVDRAVDFLTASTQGTGRRIRMGRGFASTTFRRPLSYVVCLPRDTALTAYLSYGLSSRGSCTELDWTLVGNDGNKALDKAMRIEEEDGDGKRAPRPLRKSPAMMVTLGSHSGVKLTHRRGA